jgi:hypothetical protein
MEDDESLATEALRRELELRQQQSSELRELRSEIYSIVSEHHIQIQEIRDELDEREAMEIPLERAEIADKESREVLRLLDNEYPDGIPRYIAIKALRVAGFAPEELIHLVEKTDVVETPEGKYRLLGGGLKSGT